MLILKMTSQKIYTVRSECRYMNQLWKRVSESSRKISANLKRSTTKCTTCRKKPWLQTQRPWTGHGKFFFSHRYFCGTRQRRVPTINHSKHESTDKRTDKQTDTTKHYLPARNTKHEWVAELSIEKNNSRMIHRMNFRGCS